MFSLVSGQLKNFSQRTLTDRYKGTWSEGQYEGGWLNDQPHGRGVYVEADEGHYRGEWLNGKKHGQGVYVDVFGGRYEGQWQQDEQHGRGVYTHRSGARYVGEWLNGKSHGRGVCVYDSGERYDGEWLNDNWHGQGVHVDVHGNRYKGQWLNNKKHGQGVYKYRSGEQYKGQWLNDNRHGQGVYVDVDGNRYEGQWLNGKRHGQGICVYASGARYEGEWLNNNWHGQGIHVDGSGARFEGRWLNGQWQGLFTLKKGEDSLPLEFKNDMIVPRNPIEGITIQHITENPLHPSYALIVQSTHDHNGAFSNLTGLELRNRLGKLVNGIIVTKVDSVEKLTQIKLGEKYINRVSHLWIRAHGSPAGMYFESLATIEHFKPLLNQLAPSALIVLESCSTGKISFERAWTPIAEQLATYLPTATVIAPNCNPTLRGFSGMNNGTHTTLTVAMICEEKLRGYLEKFTLLANATNYGDESNYSTILITVVALTALAVGAFFLYTKFKNRQCVC